MTTYWTDPGAAQGWAQNDAQRGLLDLPRRIAAEIVANDRPGTRVIADIGSGPGDFLAVFLERLPDTRGIWSDISPAMEELGREQLDAFSPRVEYRIADMSYFAGLPHDLDVITTSRAVHHLSRAALRDFYADTAQHLAPGGWLVNLDHFGPNETWNARLRAARRVLVPRTQEQPPHHHDYPLAGVDDHVRALAAAGFRDYDTPWRGFVTALFMARRDG
ncbi:MAG TPA: class I SAM-dependent methyltransferase [Jatrophihabitans sp.]|jgi:spermidine synthase|nr:class I SAM-dependent methyltransferase [Jatrophihabitans sp.]